jgi:hypothetical protein
MAGGMKLSTPEKQTAFKEVSSFILGVIGAREIEEHAFRLAGESQSTIDREARELFELLLQQPLPRSTAVGIAFTFRELVCEKIREIEGNGRGSA